MTIANAELSIGFKASQSAGANSFGATFWNGAMSLVQGFTDGTVANKFDRLYMTERTIGASSNDDLDLSGVLTDIFGATITAVELVGIVLINKPKSDAASANLSNLTLGGGTNPVVGFLGGTTPTVGPIKPGGCFVLMNPDATGLATITAGTGDILRIANGAGGSNTYQIALLLRSV
jgi:hypothetical protein